MIIEAEKWGKGEDEDDQKVDVMNLFSRLTLVKAPAEAANLRRYVPLLIYAHQLILEQSRPRPSRHSQVVDPSSRTLPRLPLEVLDGPSLLPLSPASPL